MPAELEIPKMYRASSTRSIDGDCLSVEEIRKRIFDDLKAIEWGDIATHYLSNHEDLKVDKDALERRFKEISLYIISVLNERRGTKSWKEYISYINGFVAGVVFANVTTNQRNLFLKNGVTAAGIISYNAINLYVYSLSSIRKHFELRYNKLDKLIDDAYTRKVIYPSDDIESPKNSSIGHMSDLFKAIVACIYSLEVKMKTKAERLNQRVLVNYCIDLLESGLLYLTNKSGQLKDMLHGFSTDEHIVNLSNNLFKQIEVSNFTRSFWKSLNQEDSSHAEVFQNTIARHYERKPAYTHSSKDLFRVSFRPEHFVKHMEDILQDYSSDDLASCSECFKWFVNVMEDQAYIERRLFIASGVIILSSIIYSMSFNNPFGIGQLSYTILYSAVAFIAAQKIDALNEEKSKKYKSFIDAKRKIAHSLKKGTFLDEIHSESQSFKPKWVLNVMPTNGSSQDSISGLNAIHPSRQLQDIQFITALTWHMLKSKGFEQRSVNRMDMAVCSMNMVISLAKIYEKIGHSSFKFSFRQASAISSALGLLVLDNIRGSENANIDPAICLRPITGIFLNVPDVAAMYAAIDKIVDVHSLQRNNGNQESSMDSSSSMDGSSWAIIATTRFANHQMSHSPSKEMLTPSKTRAHIGKVYHDSLNSSTMQPSSSGVSIDSINLSNYEFKQGENSVIRNISDNQISM